MSVEYFVFVFSALH